jgi:hypothetical protein
MKKYFTKYKLAAALYLLFIPFTSTSQIIQLNAKPNASLNYNKLSGIDDLMNNYINTKGMAMPMLIVKSRCQMMPFLG